MKLINSYLGSFCFADVLLRRFRVTGYVVNGTGFCRANFFCGFCVPLLELIV
jgi:hypothetical protein